MPSRKKKESTRIPAEQAAGLQTPAARNLHSVKETAEWTDPRRTQPLAARSCVDDRSDWYAQACQQAPCEYNPLHVVFTPEAQMIICRACCTVLKPVRLLPIVHLLIVGQRFMRQHRFCDPRAPRIVQGQWRIEIVEAMAREPGEEG